MNKAAEAESERYREAIELLITTYAMGDIKRSAFISAFIAETLRHYSAMYAIGGGRESS